MSGIGIFVAALLFWVAAWYANARLSAVKVEKRETAVLINLLIPLLFGAALLVLWEGVTRGFDVPAVLLPPPTMIWERITNSVSILWADFRQTYLKSVISGYLLGCGAGFAIAILVDRSPFLKAGIMPVGNLVSALPIVGIAPIMVMWFGFDWQSKAAVVIVMTFFPMLVNTVAGLAAAGHMERDLMRTYASNYWQTLFKLRLPAAMPFIFNALKINSTLALIGAIVAEFFGTPIVGMGFRISAEVGRLNVDMVWAEIFVAALAGSLSYGLIALIERSVTFWHPSNRN
ncbi:ABC transporter permease [Oricola thermophila]|uniref:ABC transporter permease n=1 Tax=Oricola thermophila TaxID=2742145 RepID=A0A6N1VAI3_9HYPH|nr:ABC transporter permease [Oricola thermophila]QKV17553.1 ABC transporter permease [Oricola thermophila]